MSGKSVARRLSAIWIGTCLLVLAIHIPTLAISPLMNQDEVQILEYGRTTLEPGTTWGIYWNVDLGIPVLSPGWLGPVLQELAFRATQPSNLGSRLLSVISGIAAATCLLGWLRARQTPVAAAYILSLCLLIDPILSDNYRGGRIDGWAFAACLGACWLLRAAIARIADGGRAGYHVFGAGLLIGVSPFFWLNAPILFPLVLLELGYLIRLSILTGRPQPWKTAAGILALVGAGILLSAGIAMLPLIAAWDVYWEGIKASAETQLHAAAIKNSLLALFATHDPLVAIAAIAGIVFRREYGMLLATAVAVLIIYQTMVYLPRVMYLLPYLLAMVAYATAVPDTISPARNLQRTVMHGALALLLVFNAAVTLVTRPIIALSQAPANDSRQVTESLRITIGAGPKRVLVEEWSAYFAGRELGWRQYRSGMPPERSNYFALLESLDFLVLRDVPPTQSQLDLIDEAGFEYQQTLHFGRSERKEYSLGHLEIFIPDLAYRSLRIYRRAGGPNASSNVE